MADQVKWFLEIVDWAKNQPMWLSLNWEKYERYDHMGWLILDGVLTANPNRALSFDTENEAFAMSIALKGGRFTPTEHKWMDLIP